MSTHLPVDPADPNRGGLPIDDPPALALALHVPARHGKPPFIRDYEDRVVGIVFDDPEPTVTIPAETAARLQTLGAMLAPPVPRVHPDDHPSMRELWPGQHEHHRHHDLMMAEHATTGIYRDPVSGREFPPGGAMLRDPNREQRRRLAAWRASGKVRR